MGTFHAVRELDRSWPFATLGLGRWSLSGGPNLRETQTNRETGETPESKVGAEAF
jgi:hypothetical protein